MNLTSERGGGWRHIAAGNERPYGPMDYTINLRQSLDQAGFAETKIVLPDSRISQTLVDSLDPSAAAYNATFSNAVYALGQHGCGQLTGITGSFPAQKFFCAESEVSNGWPAAQSWSVTVREIVVLVTPHRLQYSCTVLYFFSDWAHRMLFTDVPCFQRSPRAIGVGPR